MNVQVQRVVNNVAVGIYNSGKVTQHGVETSFAAAVIATPRAAGGCSIGLGSGTGNRTVLIPKTFLNVSGDYNVPTPNGPLRLNASYYYNSGFSTSRTIGFGRAPIVSSTFPPRSK